MRCLSFIPLLLLTLACSSAAIRTDGVLPSDGGGAGGGSDGGGVGGGSDGGGVATAPTVTSTDPAAAATAVAVNLPVTITFDRAMASASVNTTTFRLRHGNTDVAGAVSLANRTATFTPSAALPAETVMTATVTTGVRDLAGQALPADHSWTFTTLAEAAPPTVSSTLPANAATGVWDRQVVSATFNAPMDPASLSAQTFTLAQGGTPVGGVVSYRAASNTAAFAPSVALNPSLGYTATITTGAKSASGSNLATAHVWSFTTAAPAPAMQPVNLGSAGNYVILAKTQISTVPTSAVTGNLGISPAAATYITGFSLTADATNTFSTSPQVTGKIYAADYTAPTSSSLTTAVSDMETAFTDAAGRAADVNEIGAGNIGGMTLARGVYKWGTGVIIPTDVTLNGSATDVWIFQIAQDLIVSSAVRVQLSGGALAKNVFWQVSGLVDLGTTSHFEGIVLSQTAITMHTGASLNGRLLAQSAVGIDGSSVVQPAQ